ncbi:hypothetical protein SHKM778_46430 [Streptomyces sp. KM77-8]|uniref:Uncharacterized protein n=1 Tax=Streptomyces haneummycinicus TaxID=3074435 RepID=A0AAT9HLD1_9ACTN
MAAVSGLCAELGLVLGYYGYTEFGREDVGALYWPIVWLVVAFVAGPIFGVAGLWWREGHTARHRVVGLAALAGVFGMEGIMFAYNLHYAERPGAAWQPPYWCHC